MQSIRAELAELRAQTTLVVPSDLPLGRDRTLRRILHDAQVASEAFRPKLDQAEQEILDSLEKALYQADAKTVKKRLFQAALKSTERTMRQARSELSSSLDSAVSRLRDDATAPFDAGNREINKLLLEATGEQEPTQARKRVPEDLQAVLTKLELLGSRCVEELQANRRRVDEQLSTFFESNREEIIALQADELERLAEEVSKNLELVQLGLAVEIIDHDLKKLYRGIRASIKRLGVAVQKSKRAREELATIKASFEHLEHRYRLMSPLYRSGYRQPSEIAGEQILSYCETFFEREIESGLALTASPAFLKLKLEEVPAVILPVFVNLLDNSIYWLRKTSEPTVRLDYTDGLVLVVDNGPGVHPTLRQEVFEPFFSSKPGGRGLGLYIAKANLERYGHEIWVGDPPDGDYPTGACLCIRFSEDVIR